MPPNPKRFLQTVTDVFFQNVCVFSLFEGKLEIGSGLWDGGMFRSGQEETDSEYCTTDLRGRALPMCSALNRCSFFINTKYATVAMFGIQFVFVTVLCYVMFYEVAHSWIWLRFGFSSAVCLFLSNFCLLFGVSSGSSGNGLMWWWMTGCPLEMENCCLCIRSQAQSSGAPCWRRLTPSESYHCFALQPQTHSSCLLFSVIQCS